MAIDDHYEILPVPGVRLEGRAASSTQAPGRAPSASSTATRHLVGVSRPYMATPRPVRRWLDCRLRGDPYESDSTTVVNALWRRAPSWAPCGPSSLVRLLRGSRISGFRTPTCSPAGTWPDLEHFQVRGGWGLKLDRSAVPSSKR